MLLLFSLTGRNDEQLSSGKIKPTAKNSSVPARVVINDLTPYSAVEASNDLQGWPFYCWTLVFFSLSLLSFFLSFFVLFLLFFLSFFVLFLLFFLFLIPTASGADATVVKYVLLQHADAETGTYVGVMLSVMCTGDQRFHCLELVVLSSPLLGSSSTSFVVHEHCGGFTHAGDVVGQHFNRVVAGADEADALYECIYNSLVGMMSMFSSHLPRKRKDSVVYVLL